MCFTRRTWGLIIGYLNLLGGIFLFIISIYLLVQLSTLETNSEDELKNKNFLEIECIILLIFAAISSVCSAFLLKGISDKRHKLLIPYMVLCIIGLLFEITHFFYKIGDTSGYGTILIFGLLKIGVSAVILWIIYSLYKDIHKEQVGTPVQTSPRNTSKV